jgi:hypothetical protein
MLGIQDVHPLAKRIKMYSKSNELYVRTDTSLSAMQLIKWVFNLDQDKAFWGY